MSQADRIVRRAKNKETRLSRRHRKHARRHRKFSPVTDTGPHGVLPGSALP